jgi:HemY protein
MIRAIFIFVIFGAIIFAANWLMDNNGTIAISWQGLDINESVAWGVAMVALLVLIIVAGIWLLGLVLRAPWKIAGRQSRSRRERGQHAISMGLVAIAAGDREEACRQSKRAAQLVPNQPLATLLAAQTAQLGGDEQAAHSYFTKLAETPDTAFLGLRGLWMQAMKDGRTREALHFVEQAHAEQPNAAWVLEAQLTLQARLGQWDAASQSLETLAKRKLRTPEQAKEARALINVERSRTAAAAGDTTAGLDAALVAYKANPALVPAVAQLALMQIASNRRGRAEKALKDAWQSAPHPMLVDSFRGVVDTVSPDKQLDLARGLAGLNPNAADSHILVARFAIAADRWNDAEAALAPLTRRDPSVRVCHLMAEIEAEGRNNREAARDWLARAASAAPDEAWVCTETGAVQSDWSAVCQASQLFGTLDWRVPYHVEQHAPKVLEASASTSSTALAPAVVANDTAASAPIVVEAIAEPVGEAKKEAQS